MRKEKLLTKFRHLREILEKTNEPPYHLCYHIDRNFSYPEAKEMKEYMFAHKPDPRNPIDRIYTMDPSWMGQVVWWKGEEKNFRLIFLNDLIDNLREEIVEESSGYVTMKKEPKKPSELTIPEIQEMKKNLEKEIKDAIDDFYNRTDLKIQAIEVNAYMVKLKIEFL